MTWTTNIAVVAAFGFFFVAIGCASDECLPRDDKVMDQEFFKSVKWESRIIFNGTRIEKVMLDFSWKKRDNIKYSGVFYEVITDRKPGNFRGNNKTSLSTAEKEICQHRIDDYRTKQLTHDELDLFCLRECARWCDGTFCSDVLGQSQLDDEHLLQLSVEAVWGVEYYLRLEGYYNFSVSLHTMSESAAAVFCLDELIEKHNYSMSAARDTCNDVEYFGEIYRIGPPANLTLVNVSYDFLIRKAFATFTWTDPYDIVADAKLDYFVADTQYPPDCGEGFKKIPATENHTGGYYSYRISLDFGKSETFFVVGCCDSCTEKAKTGFASERNFDIREIDTCKPDDGTPICDANAHCIHANTTAVCRCYQGYYGDGTHEKYNGTGCHISCLDRNSLNHTCAHGANCANDVNGDAVCSCPRLFFGDGTTRGTGCTSLLAILLPITCVLILVLVIVGLILNHRHRQTESRMRMSKFVEKFGIGEANELAALTLDIGLFGKWEMCRSDITLHDVIGRGVSGVVHKATLRNGDQEKTVAVKTVPEGQAETMFLGEISLITTIGKHENVLGAIGCCTSGYPLLLVMEYMQYGDLLHFLWKAREPMKADTDLIYKLSEEDVYKIGRHVAAGMTHLSHLKIIHGDLAARNILVGKDLHCKISDFGLANDVYRYGMIQSAVEKKVPFKWISPERMMRGKVPITWRSDVWSYGILLYETVTLGVEPYPGVKQEDLFSKLEAGYRMEMPASCGEQLYKIMSRCWEWTPSKRPSFKELEEHLVTPKERVLVFMDS